jgi:multidrug efflux pump subunit AcrB
VADLELPVSQTQQQLAQDKAADALEAKQDRSNAEAKQEAKEAADKQQAELREQLTTAENSLAEANQELAALNSSSPPIPPVPPPAPTVPAPVPPRPGNPVVTQEQLQQEQAQERAQANYVLAQQQYEQQVTQRAQQIARLEAVIEQAEAAVEQLNDQLAASQEQATQQSEQTAEQEKLAEEQRKVADVRAAPIRVRDIAAVSEVLAPTTVTQIDGTPTVTVTATPTTNDLGALTAVIEQELAEQHLPAGVTATLGGASAEQQEAFSQLGLAMLLAIGLVFLIMVAAFRSLVQPLILLVSIPFAATGAVGALLLTDTPLGVPAMVGLLMLIGIVVTNAIVLIDLINQYRQRGEELRPAIVDGARLRLRPILMTACATIFALLPMALSLTGGGAFISRPLAVVVIGGLVSSTILTLLLVPVLYSLVERRSEKKRLRAAAQLPPAGQPAEA